MQNFPKSLGIIFSPLQQCSNTLRVIGRRLSNTFFGCFWTKSAYFRAIYVNFLKGYPKVTPKKNWHLFKNFFHFQGLREEYINQSFLADTCANMVWVSESQDFDDLFRSETQELDVLEEDWTKNRVSERSWYISL